MFSARLDIPSTTVVTVHINDRERLGRFLDLEGSTVEVGNAVTTYCISLDKVVVAQPGNDMSNIGQLVFLARSRRDGAILSIGAVRLSQARCGADSFFAGEIIILDLRVKPQSDREVLTTRPKALKFLLGPSEI